MKFLHLHTHNGQHTHSPTGTHTVASSESRQIDDSLPESVAKAAAASMGPWGRWLCICGPTLAKYIEMALAICFWVSSGGSSGELPAGGA